MQETNFEETLETILKNDRRYHRDAYFFVREALDHTQKQVAKKRKSKVRHIKGQELLEGIRACGLEQFGPMTLTVLHEWGVRRCEDFGEIVFNMVENRLLAKTDQDSREDFQGGYDFEETFCQPFLPKSRRVCMPRKEESAQA
jgi:uncharacterized repeat protein (TIGR04138 family)